MVGFDAFSNINSRARATISGTSSVPSSYTLGGGAGNSMGAGPGAAGPVRGTAAAGLASRGSAVSPGAFSIATEEAEDSIQSNYNYNDSGVGDSGVYQDEGESDGDEDEEEDGDDQFVADRTATANNTTSRSRMHHRSQASHRDGNAMEDSHASRTSIGSHNFRNAASHAHNHSSSIGDAYHIGANLDGASSSTSGAAIGMGSGASAGLRIGMRVMSRYGGGTEWYPGSIARDNGDGTFEINYDDGDSEEAVPSHRLRVIDTGNDSGDGDDSSATNGDEGNTSSGKDRLQLDITSATRHEATTQLQVASISPAKFGRVIMFSSPTSSSAAGVTPVSPSQTVRSPAQVSVQQQQMPVSGSENAGSSSADHNASASDADGDGDDDIIDETETQLLSRDLRPSERHLSPSKAQQQQQEGAGTISAGSPQLRPSTATAAAAAGVNRSTVNGSSISGNARGSPSIGRSLARPSLHTVASAGAMTVAETDYSVDGFDADGHDGEGDDVSVPLASKHAAAATSSSSSGQGVHRVPGSSPAPVARSEMAIQTEPDTGGGSQPPHAYSHPWNPALGPYPPYGYHHQQQPAQQQGYPAYGYPPSSHSGYTRTTPAVPPPPPPQQQQYPYPGYAYPPTHLQPMPSLVSSMAPVFPALGMGTSALSALLSSMKGSGCSSNNGVGGSSTTGVAVGKPASRGGEAAPPPVPPAAGSASAASASSTTVYLRALAEALAKHPAASAAAPNASGALPEGAGAVPNAVAAAAAIAGLTPSAAAAAAGLHPSVVNALTNYQATLAASDLAFGRQIQMLKSQAARNRAALTAAANGFTRPSAGSPQAASSAAVADYDRHRDKSVPVHDGDRVMTLTAPATASASRTLAQAHTSSVAASHAHVAYNSLADTKAYIESERIRRGLQQRSFQEALKQVVLHEA